MIIGQNGVLRYEHLGEFLGDRMANLGLFDFKLGLYFTVYVNHGKNKFKVYISKNWHKIDQMPLLGKNIKLA